MKKLGKLRSHQKTNLTDFSYTTNDTSHIQNEILDSPDQIFDFNEEDSQTSENSSKGVLYEDSQDKNIYYEHGQSLSISKNLPDETNRVMQYEEAIEKLKTKIIKKRKLFMILSFIICIHLLSNICFFLLQFGSDQEKEDDWSFAYQTQQPEKQDKALKVLRDYDLELGPQLENQQEGNISRHLNYSKPHGFKNFLETPNNHSKEHQQEQQNPEKTQEDTQVFKNPLNSTIFGKFLNESETEFQENQNSIILEARILDNKNQRKLKRIPVQPQQTHTIRNLYRIICLEPHFTKNQVDSGLCFSLSAFFVLGYNMYKLKEIDLKSRKNRKHQIQTQALITILYILFTFYKIQDSIMEIQNSTYEYDKISNMVIFENIIIIAKLFTMCSILFLMSSIMKIEEMLFEVNNNQTELLELKEHQEAFKDFKN